MNFRILIRTTGAILSALTLGSCVVAVKGETPTKGRRLSDLKTALQSGAITPAEYKSQKAAVLASPEP